MRHRILSYDSTFGLERTDAITLQTTGRVTAGHHRLEAGRAGLRRHEDVVVRPRRARGDTHPGRYQPGWYGVDVPKTGTTMRVKDLPGNGTVNVHVNW